LVEFWEGERFGAKSELLKGGCRLGGKIGAAGRLASRDGGRMWEPKPRGNWSEFVNLMGEAELDLSRLN
jgi:hypothetical protein